MEVGHVIFSNVEDLFPLQRGHTFDGFRNPANQLIRYLSHDLHGFIHVRWFAGFLPSTVFLLNHIGGFRQLLGFSGTPNPIGRNPYVAGLWEKPWDKNITTKMP